MTDIATQIDFQPSKIEDEPILGTVLRLPDGRIQALTFTERLMLTLRLTDARQLESRYFTPAKT